MKKLLPFIVAVLLSNHVAAQSVNTAAPLPTKQVDMESLKPRLIVGSDGWLFFHEEFIDAPYEGNIDNITRTIAALEKKGIKVILVLGPSKVRFYDRFLDSSIQFPNHLAERYDKALQQFTKAGIAAVDLKSYFSAKQQNMSPNLFDPHDSHWSPIGTDFVAERTAQQIKTLATYQSIADKLSTRANSTINQPGDLVRLLPDSLKSAYPSIPAPSFDYKLAEPGLLDEEKDPEITLIGTSYSARYSDLFAKALAFHLQKDIVSYAKGGQGIWIPMQNYLNSAAFSNNMPKILIWEIPERFLHLAPPAEWFSQNVFR